MTAAEFRRIALSLPGAVESAHMGHPDFRVGGRVFATLGYPDSRHGMVALTPDEQAFCIGSAPATFTPAAGGWGRKGSTLITLRSATHDAVASALKAAWQRRAGQPPAPTRGRKSP